MRWIGEDLIHYLRNLCQRLDFIAQVGEFWEIHVEKESLRVLYMPRTDPLPDGIFFAKKNMHDITTDTPVIPARFSIPETMSFAWSLPISTLITGAENKEFLEEKIQLSKNFAILSTDEKSRIIESVSDLSIYGKLEHYKKV